MDAAPGIVRDLALLMGDVARIQTRMADLIERVSAYRGPMADDPEAMDRAAEHWARHCSGEHGQEAVVPLPEGASIPVAPLAPLALVSHDEVRGALMRFTAKYGDAAVQQHGPDLIGAPRVSAIIGQAALQQALTSVLAAIENGIPEAGLPPAPDTQEPTSIEPAPDGDGCHLVSIGPAETSLSSEEPSSDGSGAVQGRESEPTAPTNARPETSPAAQHEAQTDSGRNGSAEATGREQPGIAYTVQAESFVTVAGAGEDVSASADPVPVPDALPTATIEPNDSRELVEIPIVGVVGEIRWNDDVDAKLTKLWNAGTPTKEIAAALGAGFTKNMVLRRSKVLGLGVHPKYAEAAARLDAAIRAPAPATDCPAPVAPPRKRVGGHVVLVPFGPIALDETAHVIAGPGGEWQAPRAVVKVVKRLALMKPEEMLDAQSLANAGDWASKQLFLEYRPKLEEQLEAIGIRLITFGREYFRIQVAEVAA